MQTEKLSTFHTIIKKSASLLPRTLLKDRQILKRELLSLKSCAPESFDTEDMKKRLSRLEKKIQASVRRKIRRAEKLKLMWDKINACDPNLPIADRKADIVRAISENSVVIISGETGSGKTTQIPKFCLAAGRGLDGKIGCTQPRRIAAVTVARRIAEEMGETLGKSVGYKIRFSDRTDENAYIKIMTDGILLAETQGDPYLNEYDTIIVDEAHERSLNIDFVLGILKTLVKKRKDLKLIITSATIDTEKFSKAFDNAPIIEVSGRMYPVEVRYSPIEDAEEQTHVEAAAEAVGKLCRESRHGDVLVFMPTEQDIRETCEILDGMSKDRKISQNAVILPLYARLSAAEQSRVFDAFPGRKIIVATNVAETSVTIPGIRYVVDTGLARISQYMPASRATALPVVPISASSADQRKGRCGRVADGICIRLFSEEDFVNRPLFTPPEILRSNLAEVILRMISLNLGDISAFPFIDAPALKNVKDGFNLLSELGAITQSENEKQKSRSRKTEAENRFVLTEKGRLMARMPIDPRLSRMLIEAQTEGCAGEMAVIASALSLQDPRERPSEKQEEADRAHALFKHPASDFITLLNIWNKYHETLQTLKSTNQMKKFCKTHFLSFRRMREWRDIHAQIVGILEESGNSETILNSQFSILNSQFPISDSQYAGIHKSVLSGFISNIALKKDKYIFQAAKGRDVMIFPGSGLFSNPGAWIVAAEMVETSRLFARTVANIDVEWIEPLAKGQCKYSYFEPHWERNRGEVVAYEQVSVFGLVIVPKRPVSYGRIAAEEACDIFVQSALVEADVRQPFPFMKHNRNLIDEVKDTENKIRKRDILIGEPEIYQFYRERLEGVYDIRTLNSYLKKKGNDDFLRMKKSDLFRYLPDENELNLYPDRVLIGNRRFDCSYNFDPGKPEDGITVKVPSALAASVSAESLDWLVPGLLGEKITALIKGLPKAYRKQLVPVSNTVEVIMKEMPEIQPVSVQGSGRGKSEIRIPGAALLTALGNFIHERFRVDIPASAWNTDVLPDHLRMRISLTGTDGKELCSGREKSILGVSISENIDADALAAARKQWEKSGIVRWDFGDLPETVIVTKDRNRWTVYPALTPDEQCVNLRLFEQQNEAGAAHRQGVEKLFVIHFSNDLKFLKKALVLKKQSEDHAQYFGGTKVIEKRIYERILADFFRKDIRKQSAFYAYTESVKNEMLPAGKKLSDAASDVLKAFHHARSRLYDMEKANALNGNASFFKTLREELSLLVPETFTDLYDTDRMAHLERYIKALVIRAEKGLVNLEKDLLRAKEIRIYSDCLKELVKAVSPSVSEQKRAAIAEFFWLLEEYKVSVFAQELKTAAPVSKKRLDKMLKDIERMV